MISRGPFQPLPFWDSVIIACYPGSLGQGGFQGHFLLPSDYAVYPFLAPLSSRIAKNTLRKHISKI